MNSLSRGELKKLALHQALVSRISSDSEALAIALRRLAILRVCNPHGAPYYDRWETLIRGPLPRLIQALTGTDAPSVALRQESPFGDLVDQRERARIYEGVANSPSRA